MPLEPMCTYLVRFKLADAEHIAQSIGILADTTAKAKHIRNEILRSLNPVTLEFPEGNPDFQLLEVRAVKDENEIRDAHYKLLKENPNRKGAEVLVAEGVIDVTNRILLDPKVTQDIAAENAVG